jgi:hypothetical protein
MHAKPIGPHPTCKSITTTTYNAFLYTLGYVKNSNEVLSQMRMG